MVSGCAVQASKPRPVNVGVGRRSAGRRSSSRGARRLVAVLLAAAKVRASARPEGAVTSGGRVGVGDRAGDLAGRGRVVAGGHHHADRGAVGGDDPVRGDDALQAAGRQVHGLGAADEVRRAGGAARVAQVDGVPVEAHAARARRPGRAPATSRAPGPRPRGTRRSGCRRVSLAAAGVGSTPTPIAVAAATATAAAPTRCRNAAAAPDAPKAPPMFRPSDRSRGQPTGEMSGRRRVPRRGGCGPTGSAADVKAGGLDLAGSRERVLPAGSGRVGVSGVGGRRTGRLVRAAGEGGRRAGGLVARSRRRPASRRARRAARPSAAPVSRRNLRRGRARSSTATSSWPAVSERCSPETGSRPSSSTARRRASSSGMPSR